MISKPSEGRLKIHEFQLHANFLAPLWFIYYDPETLYLVRVERIEKRHRRRFRLGGLNWVGLVDTYAVDLLNESTTDRRINSHLVLHLQGKSKS